MGFLSLKINGVNLVRGFLGSLILAFCFSGEAEVKKICPRLEGQNFLCDGSGGGAVVCVASSCEQYPGQAAELYTCQSFGLCNGMTCSGTKTEEPCPDPSTLSRCEPPPSRVCATCPAGTAPPNITCSGTCYYAETTTYTYKVSISVGQVCLETGTREVCTITEAGKDCHGEDFCARWGDGGTRCETATGSCVSGYRSEPNEIVGCSCKCGPSGMTDPGPGNCGVVPPDQC